MTPHSPDLSPVSFSTGSFPLRSIALDSIRWEDTTCLLRFGREGFPSDLASSLQLHGLINPPLVFGSDTGRFGIACGFARLRAAKALGAQDALMRVAPSDTPVFSLLMAAIEDNLYSRGFNPIEVAIAIERCGHFVSDSEICSSVLPALRLAPSPSLLQRYRAYRCLHLAVQEYLAAGRFPEGLVDDIGRFAEKDQEVLVKCIIELRLTFSMAREFLRQLQEISRRDEVSIAHLLEECGYPAASQSEANQQNRLRSALLARIHQRRYPHLMRLEQDRMRHVEALHLPENMAIHFPKNFEGDECALEMKVRNPGDLEAAAGFLTRLVAERRDDLDAIFNPSWEG